MTGPVVVGARSARPGVLRLAMREALARRTYVRVVHCCPPSATPTGQATLDDLRRQAHLDDHLSPPVCFELSGPRVVDVLERAARSASALVLGCTDSRWFTELRPDDVVARLARHADSPVTVVPEDCAT
ncbi:MAG: universal stress protein, partial [Actinomycetales bacterium]